MTKDLDDQKDVSLKQDKVIKLLLTDEGENPGNLVEQSRNSTTLIDMALNTHDCSAWNRAMYPDKNISPIPENQSTLKTEHLNR